MTVMPMPRVIKNAVKVPSRVARRQLDRKEVWVDFERLINERRTETTIETSRASRSRTKNRAMENSFVILAKGGRRNENC